MNPCAHAETSLHPLFDDRDYVTGDSFTIHRCPDCGMAFTLPAPPDEKLGRYYPEAYYGDPGRRRFPGIVEVLQRRLYESRACRVGRIVQGPSRRVLDVGCGKGFLLDAFRRQGWRVQGVELSEHSARHGREVLGLNIHVGSPKDPEITEGRFEVATLWHVLEHARNPAQLLEEINALLEPGGVLLVSVPDFGCPEARFSTSGWFHLDVPRHLMHFSEDPLRELLKASGFDIVERWRFTLEFDLFSFVQSTLNWMGLPQNHLYRILRGRGAKLPSLQDRGWHTLVTLVLALAVGLLGLVWIPVAGWLGHGSTLTFLARKQKKGRLDASPF